MVDQHPDSCECLPCKLVYWRSGRGLQIDPRATPSRRNSTAPAAANPAWEAGVAGEHRRDGTFMPYIHETTMNPIGLKEFGERRRELEPVINDNHRHRATVE